MTKDIVTTTLDSYEQSAESFRRGTWDHDVSQNRAALLAHIEGTAPLSLLDFGCGPGRDVAYFASLGHDVTGLDGCAAFCAMVGERPNVRVLHQDFLQLSLPRAAFDGIFANASLFHVPTSDLRRVLGELRASLRPRGVLFCSNPRGEDTFGWSNGRYGVFHSLATWRAHLDAVGFDELDHYYRPHGRPRAEQPWLATVWRRRD